MATILQFSSNSPLILHLMADTCSEQDTVSTRATYLAYVQRE
jgi:hypothetical protein